MSEQHRHDEPLDDLPARLAQLVPSAVGLDRDKILFEAGRRAGRRQAGRWNFALAGVFVLALFSLVWTGAFERSVDPDDGTLAIQAQQDNKLDDAANSEEPRSRRRELPPSGYLALRERLESGDWTGVPSTRMVDAPPRQESPEPPAHSRRALEQKLLEELLNQS